MKPMTKLEQRAERLYMQAITDPDVNAARLEEVLEYVHEWSDRLFIDGDRAVAYVEAHHPEPTTQDFKRASELVEGDGWT